jgi:hypothetical protein
LPRIVPKIIGPVDAIVGAQSVKIVKKAAGYPPRKPSSKEFGCSGGNPAATWRTIEMIPCTISPRMPSVVPCSKYLTAARISALASSAPENSHRPDLT